MTRYPSVFVDKLGQQLRVWEKNGISDARAIKLLRLWLGYGLTQYMDLGGRYTFHAFNALRQQLGYKTLPMMFEDIRRCNSFVLLSCDIDPEMVRDSNFFTLWRPAREYPNRLTAFFSPLWHELEKEDGEAMEGSIVSSRKNCRKCEDIFNNASCNIIPSGGTATAVAADKTAAGTINNLDEISKIEKQELANQIAKAKAYFRGLIGNEDALQREPIDHLMWRMQQPVNVPKGRPHGFGLTAEQAMEVILIMIDQQLAPHFARDSRFTSTKNVEHPERRIFQVTRYVKKYSSLMQEHAVKIWRKQKAKLENEEAQRQEEALRQNRPLSPHEWQAPDGRRFYHDAMDGVMLIPADAPPRPSERAHWNRFEKKWILGPL